MEVKGIVFGRDFYDVYLYYKLVKLGSSVIKIIFLLINKVRVFEVFWEKNIVLYVFGVYVKRLSLVVVNSSLE